MILVARSVFSSPDCPPLARAITALAIFSGIPAFAANANWTGGTSPDWTDDSNWSAAHPNSTTDVATFNAAGSNTTVNVGTQTLGKIVFTGATLPSYTLETGTITVGNGTIVELQSTVVNPQSISANFLLGGTGSNNPAITNNSTTARLTISGNFTSTITGTRSMALGGNPNAVTEFRGNFTPTVGGIQMQVQNGTGIFRERARSPISVSRMRTT